MRRGISSSIYQRLLAFTAAPIAQKIRGAALGEFIQKVGDCNSATHGGWANFEAHPGGVRVALEHYSTFQIPTMTIYKSSIL